MRIASTTNLLTKKHATFTFNSIFYEIFGHPEKSGIWIIYGDEKNGKTWFALLLSKYLAELEQRDLLYVSAEEGTGKAFCDSIKRAGLTTKDRVKFVEYVPMDELKAYLNKRRSARIVFIDNITVYKDELKNGVLRQLQMNYPNVLFVYLAHQEDGKSKEPLGATAKLAKKLASIIVRVEGLSAFVSGRCPGGVVKVNEEKALLYHGTD